jgi:hypothetical protein
VLLEVGYSVPKRAQASATGVESNAKVPRARPIRDAMSSALSRPPAFMAAARTVASDRRRECMSSLLLWVGGSGVPCRPVGGVQEHAQCDGLDGSHKCYHNAPTADAGAVSA